MNIYQLFYPYILIIYRWGNIMFGYANMFLFNDFMPMMNWNFFANPFLSNFSYNSFSFNPFLANQTFVYSGLSDFANLFGQKETQGVKADRFVRTSFDDITKPVVTQRSEKSVSSVNLQMVHKAKSYVGVVNTSEEGNRLFSPKGYKNTQWYRQHGRWGWCCDFAVSCAKDTLGAKYPKDMITSSPAGLVAAAGKHNNSYMQVPSTNKNSWLKSNVKPGDIIYMKGSGDSGKHIAVVESVGADGKISAVSGNSRGKVRAVEYDVNTSGIYGVISLERLAA